ncbi:MAG: DUF1175 family protein [Spirochaetales bacterium]|nr:DUF1175 family protein [Spirochaetales bacterium]
MKSSLSNKILLLIVCGLVLFTVLFSVYSVTDISLTVSPRKRTLYADSNSTCFFKISWANPVHELIEPFNEEYLLEVDRGEDIIEIIKKQNGFFIQTKESCGDVVLEVKSPSRSQPVTVSIIDNVNDTDQDGFPDAAELENAADRENFRRWFISIAESQFYAEALSWYDIHKDCAGLVVFAFKEALKRHNSGWFTQYPYLIKQDIPDVQKYNYPHVPLLGDLIFRNESGAFSQNDIPNGVFAAAANANNLINYNLSYISKDPDQFEKGDVLFFLHSENNAMPFHSMIYTGRDGWLIYHTGPLDDNEKGEMRKVALTDLMEHPDRSWVPSADNPCFLGAYRWNILL